MKTAPTSLTRHTLALTSLLALVSTGIAAPVMDDFSSGYPSGGSGWAGNWVYSHYRTDSPNSRAEVRDSNPLPGTDNYLNVRYEYNLANSGGFSTVSRRFDTTEVDNQQAHRVSFDFRLDYAAHWDNSGERIVIFAASQTLSRSKAYDATTTNTWGISYDGAGGWTVVESDGNGGIRNVSPTALFKSAADAGTVYNIALDIDPTSQSFSVSISDGDRTETWENTAFNFINPSATAGGEFLHFYTETRRWVFTEYSVANLRVEQIPEPGTAALVGLAAVGIGLRAMARKAKEK